MTDEEIQSHTGLSFTTYPGVCEHCKEDVRAGYALNDIFFCKECAVAFAISNEIFYKEIK